MCSSMFWTEVSGVCAYLYIYLHLRHFAVCVSKKKKKKMVLNKKAQKQMRPITVPFT